MKMNALYRRHPEEAPVERKKNAMEHTGNRKPLNRKRQITPISQEVMEYYQNLLKEHNQFGAKNSRMEYRIF